MIERIKECGKLVDLPSLFKIEEAAGLKHGQIYKWDDAAPSVDRVIAVANVLDVSVDYLVGLTDNKTPAGKTDGQDVELSARTETIIQLLRAVPREHLDLAYDLLEGSLEAIIRHLPIPAELQSSFRVGSDR